LENDDASSPTGVSAKVSQMFPCNLYLVLNILLKQEQESLENENATASPEDVPHSFF
jgi:hypothetical protein